MSLVPKSELDRVPDVQLEKADMNKKVVLGKERR